MQGSREILHLQPPANNGKIYPAAVAARNRITATKEQENMNTDPNDDSTGIQGEPGIQSLERGLLILQLLAARRRLSATAIANELGIHQSSASRLLNSLHKAGFVYKPDFHSFAIDYGALFFAGKALNCFPAIRAATTECNRLNRLSGLSATVGMLWQGRILYLTRVNQDASQVLIDDTYFPLHHSSIGLVLLCGMNNAEAMKLLETSLRRAAAAPDSAADAAHAVGLPQTSAASLQEQARDIYVKTREVYDRYGFFYGRNIHGNSVNAAMEFMIDEQPAALAVFSRDKYLSIEKMRPLLREGIGNIVGELSKG